MKLARFIGCILFAAIFTVAGFSKLFDEKSRAMATEGLRQKLGEIESMDIPYFSDGMRILLESQVQAEHLVV